MAAPVMRQYRIGVSQPGRTKPVFFTVWAVNEIQARGRGLAKITPGCRVVSIDHQR